MFEGENKMLMSFEKLKDGHLGYLTFLVVLNFHVAQVSVKS